MPPKGFKKLNKYIISGNIALIEILSPKYGYFYAIIDAIDINKVKNYCWRLSHGYVYSFYYNKDNIRNDISLQELIVKRIDGLQIDHINHNTLDNRKENLRLCTIKQNQENLIKSKNHNKTSGIRGVCWKSDKSKWKAYLTHNRKQIHGGYFSNIDDAQRAAIELRKKYFTHSLI